MFGCRFPLHLVVKARDGAARSICFYENKYTQSSLPTTRREEKWLKENNRRPVIFPFPAVLGWLNGYFSLRVLLTRGKRLSEHLVYAGPSPTNALLSITIEWATGKGRAEDASKKKALLWIFHEGPAFFPLSCWRNIMKSSFLKRKGKRVERELEEADSFGQTPIYDR